MQEHSNNKIFENEKLTQWFSYRNADEYQGDNYSGSTILQNVAQIYFHFNFDLEIFSYDFWLGCCCQKILEVLLHVRYFRVTREGIFSAVEIVAKFDIFFQNSLRLRE